MGGVICANFGLDCGPGKPMCFNGWHGACYTQLDTDRFPALGLQDLDDPLVDDEQMEVDDPLRFKEARDGDHLMVTFVCDDCVFWDLRNPLPNIEDIQDVVMMTSIRRVILDSFWSRERSTVQANQREGVRYVKIHREFGVESPYRARGPWDVSDDHLGYRAAIAMVLRSLDPGLYANYIQYETTRKMRSHVSNFEHTTPGGVGAAFVGDEGRVSFLSNGTNSP